MTTHYFISDAHFGSGWGDEEARTLLFNQFVDTLIGKDVHLYILGDFFDFWIEYGHVVRTSYVKVVGALHNLTRNGIPVTIVRGNHDFMDYSYFSRELGITVLDGHNRISINGISFDLCHGDSIAGDWKYRALHKILKNRTAQRLYRWFHPAIGVGLATSLSRLSRKKSSKSGRYLSDERQNWYHAAVDSRMKESGDQVTIMGHTHRADLSQLKHGIYVNSGTWLSAPTVIILEGNRVALTEFDPESPLPFVEKKHLFIGDNLA
jgi:UDP-2,3-diacylglucosamine hydrolase